MRSTGLTDTVGTGRSLSFSVENRAVKSVLDCIDIQIERIMECGSFGSFSACTYVLTNSIDVNMLASSLFNALISGERSNIQLAKVNTWGISGTDEDKADVSRLTEYISKLTHPRFSDFDKTLVFTPASLVSGKELSVQLGFPKKSIQGMSVIYKVPFGRNVIRSSEVKKPLMIGDLYNLGETDKKGVKLDLDSLTSHLFVTGSTGTGKSNTIYKLLEVIHSVDESIHFMVVEPAKGEYKDVFGHLEDVNVYSTNPNIAELININPSGFFLFYII